MAKGLDFHCLEAIANEIDLAGRNQLDGTDPLIPGQLVDQQLLLPSFKPRLVTLLKKKREARWRHQLREKESRFLKLFKVNKRLKNRSVGLMMGPRKMMLKELIEIMKEPLDEAGRELMKLVNSGLDHGIL